MINIRVVYRIRTHAFAPTKEQTNFLVNMCATRNHPHIKVTANTFGQIQQNFGGDIQDRKEGEGLVTLYRAAGHHSTSTSTHAVEMALRERE